MDNTTNWEHLESTDCSIRGLENKTKVGRRKRYAELAAVIAAVIDEQDAQYARGILKASVIAKLCEMHTRQSMTQARSQGLKDARVAKLLLR
jgi:alpha-D-ribose 1-methylphosphonate 5-triphosphate synthase subunit PhnG